MFLFAGRAGDAALAVAFDRPVAKQGHGAFAEGVANGRAGLRQLRQVGHELAGVRIAYDDANRHLDEAVARLPAVMPDFMNGGKPTPHIIVFFNFHRMIHSRLPRRARLLSRLLIF